MSFKSEYERLLDWAHHAEEDGWLSRSAVIPLEHIEQQEVGRLFRKQNHRPLIVGLFGGTGVGKSTLLNRLAGDSVARTGVERPTSHEVTLFVHKDFELDMLPADLPTEETKIAYHNQGSRRLVAWLDMPDIDSTATHNQEIVQSWLPYIDWVIYVVSPERYYDDIGWRFLQERAHRHAWLFVMNHFDQGTPEQLEDFRRRLMNEGFEDPIVLRSSCVEPPVEDDFHRLEETINQAIETYGLDMLQRLGVQARIDDLVEHGQQFGQLLGTDADWQKRVPEWRRTVTARLEDLGVQMRTTLAAKSHQFFNHASSGGYKRLIKQVKGEDEQTPQLTILSSTSQKIVEKLWDARSERRIINLNEDLVSQLQVAHLPYQPAAQTLEVLDKERMLVREALEDGANTALVNPGTRLQRAGFYALGWLSWFFPVAAAGWAIVHVLERFYKGTQGESSFLGLNFVINAGLMIFLAWLLPWLLRMKVKPSLAAALKKGLNQGINRAVAGLETEYRSCWEQLQKIRQNKLRELQGIQEGISELKGSPFEELGGIFVRKPDENPSDEHSN